MSVSLRICSIVASSRLLAACAIFIAGCDTAGKPRDAASADAKPSVDALAKVEEADKKPPKEHENQKTSDDEGDGLPKTSYKVPNAPPAELVEFMKSVPAQMRSPKDIEKAGEAIVTAAEQILQKNPDQEQRRFALANMYYWLQKMHERKRAEADQVLGYWRSHALAHLEDQDQIVADMAQRSLMQGTAYDWSKLLADRRTLYLEELKTYFTRLPLDGDDLELAHQIADQIDSAGDRESAAIAYRSLAEVFQTSGDPAVAAQAGRLEGMARRLSLFGKPLNIEGTLLDGQPIDWSDFRGKVVLVDFWATWCGPCIEEMENIKQLYEQYHDQGFEVVGLSLDDNPEQVKAFVDKQQIPWPIMFSFDEKAGGMNSPMAMYYGVSSLPATLLVDREGNLVALEARGTGLQRELAARLGPAAQEKTESPAPEEEKPSKALDIEEPAAQDGPTEGTPPEPAAAEQPAEEDDAADVK